MDNLFTLPYAIVMSGIYKIVNMQSGTTYIGQSMKVTKRWNEHRSALRNKRHGNSHLQRAWDLYGEACFEFVILETCSLANLTEREQAWADQYRSEGIRLYNQSPFLDSPSRGTKASDTTRQKQRDARLGKKFKPSKPFDILKAMELYSSGQTTAEIGKIFGVSWNTVCSALKANGVVMRRKGIRAGRGSWSTGTVGVVGGHGKRPLVCTTTSQKFESITAAAKALGIKVSEVSAVLRGRRKSTHNLHFQYLDTQAPSVATKDAA